MNKQQYLETANRIFDIIIQEYGKFDVSLLGEDVPYGFDLEQQKDIRLFETVTEEEFKNLKKAEFNKLKENPTEIEFTRMMKKLFAFFGDSHLRFYGNEQTRNTLHPRGVKDIEQTYDQKFKVLKDGVYAYQQDSDGKVKDCLKVDSI